MTATFNNTVETIDALAGLYRPAAGLAAAKAVDHLDAACRDFIALSSFVLLGTSNGSQNVSPKGGPAGFVKVLDDRRLAIPDMNGNNRLDGLRDIVENPCVGLLFMIPGMGETLRVNGAACVTVDDEVLDLFTDELRRPKTAIGVTVDTAFLHCAKALRRGDLWDPAAWPDSVSRPSPGEMLVAHTGADFTGADVDERLEESYIEDLAADLPD